MRIYTLFILFLIAMPNTLAWDWQTHQNVVEKVYNSMPKSLNLSLEGLKEGSIMPDKVFRDNIRHHYPPSLELTNVWLSVAKEEYKKENFKNASLAFGVASHYITDSFSAPHYIKGETSYQHSEYEGRSYLNLNEYCRVDINLEEALAESPKEGLLWTIWLKTKDNKIPEKAINKATRLVYLAAFETFNTECDKKTKIITKTSSLVTTVILLLIVLILALLIIKKRSKSKFS